MNFQYCSRVTLHVSSFLQDKGVRVSQKLKRKSDQALLDVVLCRWSALSTKSLGVVLQSSIRRHCTVGGVVPYPQKMPKAEVPTAFGQYRSIAQKGIVFCCMQLVLEYTLSFVLKTLDQKELWFYMIQISFNPLTVFVRVIQLNTLQKCQNRSGYSASWLPPGLQLGTLFLLFSAHCLAEVALG